MIRCFLIGLFFFCFSLNLFSWGFYAHRKVNYHAVFTLPKGINEFYNNNIEYLSEHSVDADKRKRNDKNESPRHYINIDYYGISPFDSVPRKWDLSVGKYTEDTLIKYGIVPWYVLDLKKKLTEAFINKNKDDILFLSADIGHYIADACVPLHSTLNYDGQLTNQKGIHALWESRIPELLGEEFDFRLREAQYIENPLDYIWNRVEESFMAKDSVLQIEADLTGRFINEKKNKYTTSSKKNIYSKEFIIEYNKALNGMVERRMKRSIIAVGDFWYTCWVDAEKPELID